MKRAVAIAAIGLLLYILIDPTAEAYLSTPQSLKQADAPCPASGISPLQIL